MEASTFDTAFTPFIFNYALIQAAVPGGIVDVSGCPTDPKPAYSFAVGDARLRDVLERIREHDPLNRWTLENGLVNFLPAKDTPAFLDTRVLRGGVLPPIAFRHANLDTKLVTNSSPKLGHLETF